MRGDICDVGLVAEVFARFRPERVIHLAAWAGGEWTADFNDDGAADTTDVLGFLNAFASER